MFLKTYRTPIFWINCQNRDDVHSKMLEIKNELCSITSYYKDLEHFYLFLLYFRKYLAVDSHPNNRIYKIYLWMLLELNIIDINAIESLIVSIIEFGDWKDLFNLLRLDDINNSSVNRDYIIDYIVSTFKNDIDYMNNTNYTLISDLPLQFPRENSKYQKKNKLLTPIVYNIYKSIKNTGGRFKQLREDIRKLKYNIKGIYKPKTIDYIPTLDNFINTDEFIKTLNIIRQRNIDIEINYFLDNYDYETFLPELDNNFLSEDLIDFQKDNILDLIDFQKKNNKSNPTKIIINKSDKETKNILINFPDKNNNNSPKYFVGKFPGISTNIFYTDKWKKISNKLIKHELSKNKLVIIDCSKKLKEKIAVNKIINLYRNFKSKLIVKQSTRELHNILNSFIKKKQACNKIIKWWKNHNDLENSFIII